MSDLPSRPVLRVPANDGEVLLVPALDQAQTLVDLNRARLSEAEIDLLGTSLGSLRAAARREASNAAHDYTSTFRTDIPAPCSDTPMIVAGHQPELFHPGVWIKNVALHRMAVATGGFGLNLVVDNDLCESATIRVPRRSDRPWVDRLPLEQIQPPQPWEERRIADERLLNSFPHRAAAAMEPWGIQPLAVRLDLTAAHERLADRLTAARSRLEATRGIMNLELPISRLCQTASFRHFVCHLLVHAARFHQVHNDALAEYRCRNRIRSRTHPVPELQRIDERYEAPLWTWQCGDQHRRRLYVAAAGRSRLRLSDGENAFAELPLGQDSDAARSVDLLRELEASGRRFRTRALTTTLFSRLMLTDLFVHGIGGAKYDEMTNVLLGGFYGVEAPEFVTASATLRLLRQFAYPDPRLQAARLHRLHRDLTFRAENHLQDDELTAVKRDLIRRQNSGAPGGRKRYRQFREINRRLAALTRNRRAGLEKQMAIARRKINSNQILNGRNYSFCLYPPEQLWTLFDSVMETGCEVAGATRSARTDA